MDRIKLLLEQHGLADELLSELDRVARNYESYEYGLPVGADHVGAEMREAIYRWLVKLDTTLAERKGAE